MKYNNKKAESGEFDIIDWDINHEHKKLAGAEMLNIFLLLIILGYFNMAFVDGGPAEYIFKKRDII